ncbi:hypothetical protein SAMN04489742_3730 [Arthrobacter crystallopoietes]|uniref:Uncharacterized protein n=1 Tax=Crystallibacter crystallopoietes TaxID=37928 RepID=A0A1H1FZ55_9MICC|nr:hypothetical protein SAMN04489742_3730 [Arthrobacter crystallopoietes]
METLFAAALLLVSVAAMYFLCLRPMRRGNCSLAALSGAASKPQGPAGSASEAELLREEIAELRRTSNERESAGKPTGP